MTKAEYEAQYKALHEVRAKKDSEMRSLYGINHRAHFPDEHLQFCKAVSILKSKYIASLESEYARLEKALDMVGIHIVEHENMCPWNVVDGYVSDECSECIANDKPIKSECWKAAFVKEATDVSKDM